mgnify:CR=1 FL=1
MLLVMAKEKKVQQITDMEVDFAQWYTDICRKAELVEYASVKGFAAIVDGKCDDLPEWAFFNVGTLDDARKKAADKLAEEKGGEA